MQPPFGVMRSFAFCPFLFIKSLLRVLNFGDRRSSRHSICWSVPFLVAEIDFVGSIGVARVKFI